jgi:hypothetical protein
MMLTRMKRTASNTAGASKITTSAPSSISYEYLIRYWHELGSDDSLLQSQTRRTHEGIEFFVKDLVSSISEEPT